VYHPVRASASKASEQAHRIAGTLLLLEDPELFKTTAGALCGPWSREISVDWMERGCRLANWYLDEVLRITDMAGRTEIDTARALLDWTKRRPEDPSGGWTITLAKLQGSGPPCLRGPAFGNDRRRAREARVDAVETLISAGAAAWRDVSREKRLSFFVPRGAALS
jgi:hypothetical protein